MKNISFANFYTKIKNRSYLPLYGHIDLTYRCNLDCIHCYCKGSEDIDRELSTEEWKLIIDEIHKEGCIYLAFSGGEPFIKDDFLEIYSYAKRKGFIITIFTNGQHLPEDAIKYLIKLPPFSLEITLNGVTKKTYELVTRVSGSFEKVMKTIRLLKEEKIPLKLKSNCLIQNKNEVAKIKKFTDEFLGRPSKRTYYFKYDSMIYPRLNGDKKPCNYRLSVNELLKIKGQDKDFWNEFKKSFHCEYPILSRKKDFLYQCNAWINQFFVDPYGGLKFCQFSNKFSIDLKTTPFKVGFFEVFPQLLRERFNTNSKCRDCHLRPICFYCPARAFLETGNEEGPVDYYCELAKSMERVKEEIVK